MWFRNNLVFRTLGVSNRGGSPEIKNGKSDFYVLERGPEGLCGSWSLQTPNLSRKVSNRRFDYDVGLKIVITIFDRGIL